MYWGSMMIGRWAGAVYAFDWKPLSQKLLIIFMPLLAFGIVLGANYSMGYKVSTLFNFLPFGFIQIVLILATKNHPSRTLFASSVFGAISIDVGLSTTGYLSVYAFLSAGLACSVIWPAIFNLALMGLGKYTCRGSAILVRVILGGGMIPPILGKLADIVGRHESYIVSLLWFSSRIFFGI